MRSNDAPLPQAGEPVVPMDYETFSRLWTHPVAEGARNWVPDFGTYRDACVYLMSLRRPHFARLAIPTYLQNVLIAFFLDGHYLWLSPCPSGERVKLTIWHPVFPRADEEAR